jgi:monolysocardiolipin acyltransferase
VPLVALTSKVWLSLFNRFHVQHQDVFLKTLSKHYEERKYPLITISNHSSCMDDPTLWGGMFPWSWNFSASRHRWSAAAEDICFTKAWHTLFFSLGKTFPVVRGKGIHQMAMDFAIELLDDNNFLHVYPQGRVVEDPDLDINIKRLNGTPEEQMKKVTLRDGDFDKPYALKWGLARVILDYLNTDPRPEKFVLVLPFFHIGMHHVLPNVEPYIPQVGKLVTVCVREAGPIKFDLEFVNKICNGEILTAREKRSRIMAHLEDELKMLKVKTLKFRHSITNNQ